MKETPDRISFNRLERKCPNCYKWRSIDDFVGQLGQVVNYCAGCRASASIRMVLARHDRIVQAKLGMHPIFTKLWKYGAL